MTLQREYLGGPHVVQCDDCSETVELEGDTRTEAVRDAKERGFKPHFDGRKWSCRHCDAAAREAAMRAFYEAEDHYEQTRLAA